MLPVAKGLTESFASEFLEFLKDTFFQYCMQCDMKQLHANLLHLYLTLSVRKELISNTYFIYNPYNNNWKKHYCQVHVLFQSLLFFKNVLYCIRDVNILLLMLCYVFFVEQAYSYSCFQQLISFNPLVSWIFKHHDAEGKCDQNSGLISNDWELLEIWKKSCLVTLKCYES